MEHVEGSKVVRQTTVIPAPELQVLKPQRNFEGIRDFLGDTTDIQELKNSEEVIHHYIQGLGHHRAGKKSHPAGVFTMSVRVFFVRILQQHSV